MAAQPFTAKQFGPANDNGPKDPVKTVTVRKQLEKSGVAIKIKVPVHEFVGVAVATRISEDGVLTSTIELVHGDPELNYQVFEEVGNGNVVAEWQNWGKKLRLPLYIKAGDGSMMPSWLHTSRASVVQARKISGASRATITGSASCAPAAAR